MPCVFVSRKMEKWLCLFQMRAHALLFGQFTLFPPMYSMQIYGIAHIGNTFSQGKISVVEGVLHCIFRFDEQKRHLFDGVESQIRASSKDVLVL
jgi:hypothetical protein